MSEQQMATEDGLRDLLGGLDTYRDRILQIERERDDLKEKLRLSKAEAREAKAELKRCKHHDKSLTDKERRWLYLHNVTIALSYRTSGKFRVKVTPRGKRADFVDGAADEQVLEEAVRKAMSRGSRSR